MTTKMPQDYGNGVAEMIEDAKKGGDFYEALTPLGQRVTSEVRIKTKGDGDELNELYAKFGYSMPIAQIQRLTEKLYGYERDANLDQHLEQSAVMGANALNDLILDAPCVNRELRFAVEEGRAKEWMKIIDQSPVAPNSGDQSIEDRLEDLLNRWGSADAFMLRARVVEEQRGIDEAEKMTVTGRDGEKTLLYDEYIRRKQERDDVEMESSELPPAWNMLFWCRVRQYQIMRERAYDSAMGYPTHDYTDVKAAIAAGQNIHDLVPRMPWPFREAYQLVTGSMLDGKDHRTLMMSMIAGQLPQPQVPWPMMPGYGPGMAAEPDDDEDDDEKQKDRRKAIWGINLGGKQQPAPGPKQFRRRKNRGRNR